MKKRNTAVGYFRLNPKLCSALDKRLRRMGFTSRTEFFTAAAYAALGETKQAKSLPASADTWLSGHIPQESEEEISCQLQTLIRENLTPVIAIRGTEIAFEKTWRDIRSLMHEETGIWVTESELKEAYSVFSVMNRPMLTEYKNNHLENEQ